MPKLETAKIPDQQLDILDDFARDHVGPELRDVLLSITRCIRDGEEVVTFDGDATVTPRHAAQRLGMSRTHLYKLLDEGLLSSHRVGRDRRIPMRDLVSFEMQRQRDRRELAERFSHQRETSNHVDAEIADLI